MYHLPILLLRDPMGLDVVRQLDSWSLVRYTAGFVQFPVPLPLAPITPTTHTAVGKTVETTVLLQIYWIKASLLPAPPLDDAGSAGVRQHLGGTFTVTHLERCPHHSAHICHVAFSHDLSLV